MLRAEGHMKAPLHNSRAYIYNR